MALRKRTCSKYLWSQLWSQQQKVNDYANIKSVRKHDNKVCCNLQSYMLSEEQNEDILELGLYAIPFGNFEWQNSPDVNVILSNEY